MCQTKSNMSLTTVKWTRELNSCSPNINNEAIAVSVDDKNPDKYVIFKIGIYKP